MAGGAGHTAVIPPRKNRKIQYDYDKALYRKRNVIQRMFCRVKDWRRIAARFDRALMASTAACICPASNSVPKRWSTATRDFMARTSGWCGFSIRLRRESGGCAVVSNFIIRALKGGGIVIDGDGSRTDSFCYLDDFIEGIM